MVLPPLDYFLSPVPVYGLGTSLGEIIQALGQPGAHPCSHIVVIDDEQRPLGAIPLGRLWAMHRDGGGRSPGNEAHEPRLIDCQPWLDSVVEVEAGQLADMVTLTHLGQLVQAVPPPTLAAIDFDGKYLGVLSAPRLLGWLASIAIDQDEHLPSGRGDRATTGQHVPEQWAWILELSHAIKTPMTTLLGLSTLLLDTRVGPLSDRQFRYVTLMRQAIRKLTGLVNLLLDWMHLESGQVSLNLEQVALQPLADNLLPSFLSLQAESASSPWMQNFTICLTTSATWVMADSFRLRKSLHHGLDYLLATGATPGGLLIEPWGAWLGFTLWSPEFIPTAALGMANLEAASSQSQSISGLNFVPEPQALQGLGLALARRLCQLHGGELSWLSGPTWGSRLTLLVPAPNSLFDADKTVLVVLACANETVVDQVYGSLRGTVYRLVVASSSQALGAMQRQLAPACTLLHWESLADAPDEAAARQALIEQLAITRWIELGASAAAATGVSPLLSDPAPTARGLTNVVAIATIAQGLLPVLDQICQPPSLPAELTMLLVRSPDAGEATSALPSAAQSWLQHYGCRLLQVDDLAQANLLSRVWQPQAVIFDRVEPIPLGELQALAHYPALACLPLVTLVPPELESEAVALGLNLVSCADVLNQPPAQAVRNLMRAIANLQT
ncbi:hypothetical protein IQ254_17975 [Nodosilinea sp. LEGE 07088]|uniref:histidine kinase dimerization/phospho-acceptor domain-containing protein n=1 Tax=Nodosilinea sp. LEGE 07088 TaxID=2777968 RepID=UPI00188222E8|nr:histidine kinase dimerization/phospho-acceptor domain-containing protein [Nodosilinea sp. LEGE 07088]MBE9139059.1 hypothetical protein [Nodosilinea sp. LEGE 07088]